MSTDVIYLSRFNTFCGVSTYTEQLAEAVSLTSVEVSVVTSDHGQRVDNNNRDALSDLPSVVSWKEDGPLDKTTELLINRQPKIVHIQHEFSIFRYPNALIALCQDLKRKSNHKIKIVLTAHAVPKCGVESIGRFAHLLRMVDAVIVHSNIAQRVIRSYVDQSNMPIIEIIPHGMLEPQDKCSVELAREKLQIKHSKNLFVILVLGFIAHYKKHMFLLQLLEVIHKRKMVAPEEVMVVIAGLPHPQGVVGEKIVSSLDERAKRMKISEFVNLFPEFVPFEKLSWFYGAADMTLHACATNYHSSSGSIRTDLSYGMPVLAQHSLITEDLPKDVVMLFNNEGDALNKLVLLVKREDYRDRMSSKALQMARTNCWRNTAFKHVRLYEKLMGDSFRGKKEGIRIALLHASPFFGS